MFNASGGNHGGSDGELGGHCRASWPRGNCLVESLRLCAMLDGQGAIDEFFSMILKAGTGASQSVERAEVVNSLGDKIENLIWKIQKLLCRHGHDCGERRNRKFTRE